MTLSLHFTFNISPFTLISHFSFIKLAAAKKCKLLIDNSLKIANCKLKTAATEGAAL